MRIAVVGTFGPVPGGHRALFETAPEFGTDSVAVGLASDELVPERRSELRPIPPYGERERTVRVAFDDLNRWGRDVEVRKRHDEHGIVTTTRPWTRRSSRPSWCPSTGSAATG